MFSRSLLVESLEIVENDCGTGPCSSIERLAFGAMLVCSSSQLLPTESD